MITKDLGAVSAYAYAVEKGYTGTEAEYAELMASYATVAQQASQSAQTAIEKAQQASASATSASQSADTASASATSAQTAQQTATAKASEAQQSAQTATTKAQEASQSASESSQSAQTAVQAKQDAQTAKTASETAQASAESARDDAESARDTAQQYAESIDPQKLIGAYPVDTTSGSIASFPDGADNIPMKDVTVQIDPVQDLSHGDPSPDNICPISGWTGAQVVRTGINIFDKTAAVQDAFVNDTNGVENVVTGSVCSDYISVVPNATYYIKSDQTMGAWGAWYDADKIYISGITGYVASALDSAKTKTAPSNARYMRLTIDRSGTGNLDTFSVNYPSTDHEYHPYSGNLYPITFPQEAGTVYGGTLDVTAGELVVDVANIASYNGETLPSTWISDRDAYSAGTTPTTGAQVVYKLATPITYQLTPTEIRSLLGDNNLWADTGDSTVTYRADTTLYINRKIAEAVSALS